MESSESAGRATQVEADLISFTHETSSSGLWATYFLEQEPEVLAVARFELARFILIAALSFPLYLGIVLLITRDVDNDFFRFKLLAAGLLYIPILIFAGSSGLSWTKFVRELKRAAAKPEAAKPQVVRVGLTTAGVSLEQAQSSHTLNWSMFERVVRFGNNDVGLQYTGMWNGVAIPASAFADAHAADAFALRAQRLMAASGHDQSSRLKQVLADTKLRCSCGQALLGLESAQCPECGRRLSTTTLKSLEFVQTPLIRKLFARWK